jgi:hypothetical protein
MQADKKTGIAAAMVNAWKHNRLFSKAGDVDIMDRGKVQSEG